MSVATRIFRLPLLNFARAPRRWLWLISPCIGTAAKLSKRRITESLGISNIRKSSQVEKEEFTFVLPTLFEWKQWLNFGRVNAQDRWNKPAFQWMASRYSIAVGSTQFGIWVEVSSVNLMCEGAHFDDTSTLTGFVKLALCNLATFVVIVAEYK